MSTIESKSAFISRFDRIWTQARRVQLSQAVCWSLLTALAGISLLTVVDYWWELPRVLRVAAIIAIGLLSCVVGVALIVRSVKRWRRHATAAAIEQVFPQLGQRIRTTVQFGPLSANEIEHEGVATTMVEALEDDTIKRAQPLPLDAVIPWRALAMTSLLAAVVGLTLAGASASDWQWRAAAQRAFLGDEPYTKITVNPGNLTVKEGESAKIEVIVEGRTGAETVFATHSLKDPGSEWELQSLSPEATDGPNKLVVKYDVPLTRIREPLEYRVSAGSAESEIYRVEVLYPLSIVKIQSTVQSPEYTGLPEAVIDNGNIVGLVGSQARLDVELDRAPEQAWLELQDMNRPAKDAPPPQKIPLEITGAKLTAALELQSDKTYTVVAKSADGMELGENVYRIRVRQDEAPQVWFEAPNEALEVHSLAEVLMRIRVSDDYGLAKAGIMFEVNNEEQLPLLAKDFAEAAEELKTTGKLSPKTRDSLEKVLPLEHFQLSQQDSVMYFAFAEDNRPNSPQRTESDLRFIDLRPFRRTYRVFDDPDPNGMNRGPGLKTLEELISRQRYALNRTIQIGRRLKASATPDLSGVDALIKFEGELAKSTRELAEGLMARGVDDTELLFQAEASMLGATDSLSAGKYETATLQERDALKYLIEGRNRLEVGIRKNPNRAQLAQLRQFDRMQQQKLRRPKTDEEEKKEVAQRLEQLADNEDFVYKSLAGVKMDGDMKSKKPMDPKQPMKPMEGSGDGTGKSEDPPMAGDQPDAQKADAQKPDAQKPDGDKSDTGKDPAEAKKGDQPGDDTKGEANKDGAKDEKKPGDEGKSKGDEGKDGKGDKPADSPMKSEEGQSGKPEAAAKGQGGKDDKEQPGKGAGDKPGDQQGGAGKSDKNEEGEGGDNAPELTPRELEDKQLDIALEAREVEKLLGKLKGATDLAKERIAAASKQAEEAAKELGKGEKDSAQKNAQSTSKQFRELADQVKALLAQEQADRIAAAQQMAANLARQQQDFVDKLVKERDAVGAGNPDPKKKSEFEQPGGGKGEPSGKPQDKMQGLGGQAEDIARQAKTLQDVLKAASQASDPQDQASAKQVEQLVGGMKLDELANRLQDLPGKVGSGKLEEAKSTAEDGAERLEAAAEQLASLQRAIVAPKVDELAKLEEKLAGVDKQLDELASQTEITQWHITANELLASLEKAGISKEIRQEFDEAMKSAGWNSRQRNLAWNWVIGNGGRYTPPVGYRRLLERLQEDLRNRMQELMLGDLAFSRDEAIPPQYQELVDRFQQVLATEGKDRGKAKMPAKKPAKKVAE